MLSGTGADGTRGVEAIKTQGGVTFAQDATAEHRGMPTSAIGTGCIDYVLPPDEIAHELARLGATPLTTVAASPDADEEGELRRILVMLKRATSIDFAGRSSEYRTTRTKSCASCSAYSVPSRGFAALRTQPPSSAS